MTRPSRRGVESRVEDLERETCDRETGGRGTAVVVFVDGETGECRTPDGEVVDPDPDSDGLVIRIGGEG